MRLTVQAQADIAGRAGAALQAAAGRYGAATKREMELENQRPLIKSEAISRIMSLPDPQKDGKLYSATAAESLVMTDKVYAMHRAEQSQAALDTIVARGAFEAAKVDALGALELLKLAVAQETMPAVVIG